MPDRCIILGEVTLVRFITGLAWVLVVFTGLAVAGAMAGDPPVDHNEIVIFRWMLGGFLLSFGWLLGKHVIVD